jgi:peptidyl-prolyl cis-trans isomerase D
MLDTLRKSAGSWIAKLLLMLLVLSFAVWGISGRMLGGLGSNEVIAAGDTSVSVNEYRLAYDRQISVLSQQFGTRITREQARAFGIDNQVLAQLVAGAVLDEQARRLGLGLSKDRLAGLTAEDPAFQGPDGRFDRRQFDFVLRQAGMRPEDYLRNRAQVAIRQQIVEAVSDGLAAPGTFLRAVALYRGENRTVEHIVLPQSLVEPVEDPSDEILATWFEERKATYRAPEYRQISYVKLEPEDIADPAAISDEQVDQDYQANKARYATPETRTIEQIVFANQEAAQQAIDSIRNGATFEDIVTEQGKTLADARLGTFSRDDVADPAVAEAAFSLKENEVSGIVKGTFGPLILRVSEVKPEVVKPLAQVRDEIRRDLALAEANRILLDVHDAYEDARAGGDTLHEAAAKLNLDVVTIEAVDRNGLRPDGTTVDDIPQSSTLLREAFETDRDVENPPISIGADGFVFYEVEDITPARDRSLDEVRDRVVADWKAAEATRRLAERASEAQQQIKDGASLDDLAAELGLENQTKRGIKRQTDDPDLGETGVAAVFGVPEGGTGTVRAPAGDAHIVFKVTEAFEPAGAGPDSVPDELRASFTSGMADDLLDQLVAQLQSEYGVTVNRAAIQQALNL